MLNIVLFGPPGAGKGTQSEKMIAEFDLVHFSTGEILRVEIAAETELGLMAKAKINKGELVSDDLVIGMIEKKIVASKDSKGFIFDGFPRTTAQAEALDVMLAKIGMTVSAMIALEADKDELVKRLLNRGLSSGRADDQDVSVIENRIRVYNEQTSPLIDFYKAQNKFISVNGIGSIDSIFGAISTEIGKISKN